MAKKPFKKTDDILPEGCLPCFSIRILSYTDFDGDLGCRWRLEGDPTMGSVIGLLEMTKLNVLGLTTFIAEKGS